MIAYRIQYTIFMQNWHIIKSRVSTKKFKKISPLVCKLVYYINHQILRLHFSNISTCFARLKIVTRYNMYTIMFMNSCPFLKRNGQYLSVIQYLKYTFFTLLILQPKSEILPNRISDPCLVYTQLILKLVTVYLCC